MALAGNLPETCANHNYQTVLADPPWAFDHRKGKGETGHKRLHQYETLDLQRLKSLGNCLDKMVAANAHLYLWVPAALIADGLAVMEAWGFKYKTMLVWRKVTQDGRTHGGGRGFYFRNCLEPALFGVRGRLVTLQPGRTQVNLLDARPAGHSVKPKELHEIIEACSPAPRLELFARRHRPGWTCWGDQNTGEP